MTPPREVAAAPTQALADFVAGSSWADLPVPVRERVLHLVIDTVASAIAGHDAPESAMVLATAQTLLGDGRSPVIAGPAASPSAAALANGYLITAVNLCDVHHPTLCHVTPEVVPPALAVAVERGASGADFLTAVAVGLEVTTRIGVGTNYSEFRRRGWHSPGVAGPFGGAAAAARLLGLDPGTTRHALGLAGSQAAGSFAQLGTPGIKFSQARAALSGLLAARLAEAGLGAATEVLSDPEGGVFHTHSDGGDPAAVTDGLGERWELMECSLRPWPVAAHLQNTVAAVLDLLERRPGAESDLEALELDLPSQAHSLHAEVGWDDRFRARLSARYVAAVVLHDRECWLRQFTSERVADARTGAFARDRVRVTRDPGLPEAGVRLTARFRDGSSETVYRAVPRGHPTDPLTRAEVLRKFDNAASERLPAPVASALRERLPALDSEASVGPILLSLSTSDPTWRTRS